MKFNFKKIIAIVMALLMVAALMTGCGDSSTPATGTGTSTSDKKGSKTEKNENNDKDSDKDSDKESSSLDLSDAVLLDYEELELEELMEAFADELSDGDSVEVSGKWLKSWNKGEAPEDADLESGEKKVAYYLHMKAEYEGETMEGDLYLYLGYKDGVVTVYGMYTTEDEEEEIYDQEEATDYINDLAESYLEYLEAEEDAEEEY